MYEEGDLVIITSNVNIFVVSEVVQLSKKKDYNYRCKIVYSPQKKRIGCYCNFGCDWRGFVEIL